MGCHRSAISAYHDQVNGKPVGQHPRVCALLTGAFNMRSPQPRYAFIWDVQIVLSYLKSFGGSPQLSDKMLTYKTTMLMALTSASRASALHHLDMRFMVICENHCMFNFRQLHKSWRKGAPPPSLKFYSYPEDNDMCVVATIKEYLHRTQGWRTENKKSQFFLSVINPHREVACSTISGWIKKLMTDVGINTDIFKAHSTRSASSTKASLAGLSLPDILKRGSWSNKSTWQNFYNKQVVTPEQKFQEGVFK